MVIGRARVAFVVQGVKDFDPRILLKDVIDAARALIQVMLAGDRDHNQAPLAVNQFGHAFAALEPGLVIIGPDKKVAVRLGRVGINRDDGDSGLDGGVDRVLEQFRAGWGDEDARRILGCGGFKSFEFLVRGIYLRARKLCLDAQHPGCVHESRLSFLPVRQGDVGGDKVILFVLLVEGFLAGNDEPRGRNDRKADQPHYARFHRIPPSCRRVLSLSARCSSTGDRLRTCSREVTRVSQNLKGGGQPGWRRSASSGAPSVAQRGAP